MEIWPLVSLSCKQIHMFLVDWNITKFSFFPSVQAVLIEFSDVMLLNLNNAGSTEMQNVTGWAGIWTLLLSVSHTVGFLWHSLNRDKFFPPLLADEARKWQKKKTHIKYRSIILFRIFKKTCPIAISEDFSHRLLFSRG